MAYVVPPYPWEPGSEGVYDPEEADETEEGDE